MKSGTAWVEDRVYQELLRSYRSRLNPKSVGLPSRGSSDHLSQAHVDIALGRGSYQKVESGRLRPSAEYLLQVADLFRFTNFDRKVALVSLTGSEPAAPLRPPSDSWTQVVESQQAMAFLTTHSGDLIATNRAGQELFTGGAPDNLWVWLLSPDGRLLLPRWHTEWAPHVLAEIRRARARYPKDELVQDLRRYVARDPALQALPAANCGLDSTPRALNHPALGLGRVQHLAAQVEDCAAQVITMPFTVN